MQHKFHCENLFGKSWENMKSEPKNTYDIPYNNVNTHLRVPYYLSSNPTCFGLHDACATESWVTPTNAHV